MECLEEKKKLKDAIVSTKDYIQNTIDDLLVEICDGHYHLDTEFSDGAIFLFPMGEWVDVSELNIPRIIPADSVHLDLALEILRLAANIVMPEDEEEQFMEKLTSLCYDVEECCLLILDLLLSGYDVARLNSGRSRADARMYCVLPKNRHGMQLVSLKELIMDCSVEHGADTIIIYIMGASRDDLESYVYVFGYDEEVYRNSPDDVVKAIKRYYSDGVFYESKCN